MEIIRKYLVKTALYALLTLVFGCQYKPLEYAFDYAGTGSVAFDWQGDSTCVTSFMAVTLHDGPDREPRRYDFPGKEGGTFRIRPGWWTPVAWNGDVPAIVFVNGASADSYMAYSDNYVAHTRSTSIKAASRLRLEGDVPQVKAAAERVITEPDPLWFAVGEPMEMRPNEATPAQVLAMEPRTIRISIVVRGIANLGWTSQFAGSLSGLADGVHCATGIPTTEPATEAFYLSCPSDSTLVASFEAFGLCPEDGGIYPENWLTLYFVLGDGTRFYCTIDVTEALRNAPWDDRTRTLELVIDGSETVPLPAPMQGNSGFVPSIDDWYGVEVPLTMDPNPKK